METSVGPVEVRYERCPAGWSARFTLRDPLAADVAVVHRLVAPSLREARKAVPAAIDFLNGAPPTGAFAGPFGGPFAGPLGGSLGGPLGG